MALNQGDIWVCKDPKCGAEITVTKGTAASCPGTFTPRCCCGQDMVKK